MRLPSIDRALAGARIGAVRFPLVIASGILTALAFIVLVGASDEDPWLRLAAAASLGLPLFTALSLAAHRLERGPAVEWGLRALGVLLLAAFYWRWPAWSQETAALRYFHLSAGFHLLAAVAAYVGTEEPVGFWQFNRSLFLRFLTGAVYSIVLFAGLAVALAGIDNLLGVDIDGEQYARLWGLIAFVFNTWFFTAGIPVDFARLQKREEYPSGLRAFAQYVLLPLVAVYLVILTMYLVRILVTREWPSGWIGYLVSALAALGILSLLLVHPLRDRSDQGWIDRYARSFWVAILPSVAMLLMAIWQRIAQYGITERRYLLTILAVWLATVAVFYAVTRSRNIKVIPASLAAVAFLTFLGPWSAYSVSLRSQVDRLSDTLERHRVLEDGRASPTADELPVEDRREITGALTYVIRYHGTGAIDDWFADGVTSIDSIGDGTQPSTRYDARRRTTLIMRHLGIEPLDELPALEAEFRHYSAARPGSALDVDGFEWAFTAVPFRGFDATLAGRRIGISLADSGRALEIARDGTVVVSHPLGPFIERLDRSGDVPGGVTLPADSLRLDVVGGGLELRLYLHQVTIDLRTGPPGVASANGDVFIRTADDEAPPPESPR